MALKPDVFWAQGQDSVYVTIDLKDVQDMNVTLDGNKLSFSGKVGGSLYEFDLGFHAPINNGDSKWSTKRLIEFYLKKEKAEMWPRLAKSKQSWIKVDWKRWQGSDDESDGMPGFDVDGVGDINVGGLMGGGDELDSNDDDTGALDTAPLLDPGASSSRGSSSPSSSSGSFSPRASSCTDSFAEVVEPHDEWVERQLAERGAPQWFLDDDEPPSGEESGQVGVPRAAVGTARVLTDAGEVNDGVLTPRPGSLAPWDCKKLGDDGCLLSPQKVCDSAGSGTSKSAKRRARRRSLEAGKDGPVALAAE